MAANKIVFGNKVLIDLTSDTVSESNLLKGFKAHDKTGMQIIGTYEAEELIGEYLGKWICIWRYYIRRNDGYNYSHQ